MVGWAIHSSSLGSQFIVDGRMAGEKNGRKMGENARKMSEIGRKMIENKGMKSERVRSGC
jgi:hypothetical protein